MSGNVDTGVYVATGDKGYSIVDSCANRYLTRNPGDFLHMSDKICRIQGTGGAQNGKIGRLKPNDFSKEGVLLPLPGDMQRILPWLGEGNMAENFDMTLYRDKNNNDSNGNHKNTGNTIGGELFHVSGRYYAIEYARDVALPVLSACNSVFVSARGIANTTITTSTAHTYSSISTDHNNNKNIENTDDFLYSPIDLVCSPAEALRIHKSMGHFYIPGLKHPPCDECDRCKGAKKSHPRVREETEIRHTPLQK